MKLRFTLATISLLFIVNMPSQAQNWLKTIGGANGDVPYAIAQDAGKNVYVGGAFSGTNVDFNPGGTAVTLSTTLSADNGFFAKYNAGGVLQWVIAYPRGTGGTRVNSITFDAEGYIYVAGWMDGSNVDFNPYGSPMPVSTTGNQDIFMAKYSSAGICQWVRIIGGASFADQATSIDYNAADNTLVMAGQFISTTNFNPAGTAMTVTPAGGAVAGNSDIFFAKYNTSGICQWVRTIGVATLSDVCNAVAVDGNGDIIIGGWSTGNNVNFNPGGTAVLRSNNGTTGSQMYIAKYNGTGILQWIVHTGGFNGSDQLNGLDVDVAGNVYAAGSYTGTGVEFNPNGTSSTFSASGTDAFVAKYSSAGVLQWARTGGGTSTDRARCVAVNAAGDVFMGGQFSGTNVNFNPGGTAFNLTAANTDPFLICYSSAGVPQWGFALSSSTTADDIKAIAPDNTAGKLFVAGQFQSVTPTNFDPLNSTATTQSNIGSTDIFVARYSMSTGLLSLNTLPVSWTKIDAQKNGDKVALRWETSCEINNEGFSVERSTDGTIFHKVGYVASTASRDCGKAAYSFTDHVNGVEGKIYYRLKQTDIDGKQSHSKIVTVSNDASEKLSVQVYPNPAINQFNITRSGMNAPDKAIIYTGSGKIMTRLSLAAYNKVDCSQYAPGIYYINYYKNDKMVGSDKLIINR